MHAVGWGPGCRWRSSSYSHSVDLGHTHTYTQGAVLAPGTRDKHLVKRAWLRNPPCLAIRSSKRCQYKTPCCVPIASATSHHVSCSRTRCSRCGRLLRDTCTIDSLATTLRTRHESLRRRLVVRDKAAPPLRFEQRVASRARLPFRPSTSNRIYPYSLRARTRHSGSIRPQVQEW